MAGRAGAWRCSEPFFLKITSFYNVFDAEIILHLGNLRARRHFRKTEKSRSRPQPKTKTKKCKIDRKNKVFLQLRSLKMFKMFVWRPRRSFYGEMLLWRAPRDEFDPGNGKVVWRLSRSFFGKSCSSACPDQYSAIVPESGPGCCGTMHRTLPIDSKGFSSIPVVRRGTPWYAVVRRGTP